MPGARCGFFALEGGDDDTGDEHHQGDGKHVGLDQGHDPAHDGRRGALAEHVDGHDRQQVGGNVENHRRDQQRPGTGNAVRPPRMQLRAAATATRMLVPVGAIQLVALAADQNAGIDRTHCRSPGSLPGR